jgi:hypothetical protein
MFSGYGIPAQLLQKTVDSLVLMCPGVQCHLFVFAVLWLHCDKAPSMPNGLCGEEGVSNHRPLYAAPNTN